MAEKFFWIKLKNTFMTSDTVDFLMSQKDGANYVVLYQMLCLKTVNTNGELARHLGEIIVPFDEEKIQRDCKYFSLDTIRIALSLYKKLELVYQQENGILKISNFENLVGSECDSAERMRRLRAKETTQQLPSQCDAQSDKNVTIDKDIRVRDKILDTTVTDINTNVEKEYKEKANGTYVPSVNEKAVFDFWNEQGIYTHRDLNEKTGKKIKAALRIYTVEQIKEYISRYKQLFKDPKCKFKYKWSLENFLSRENGISTFTDDGEKWVNYQSRGNSVLPQSYGDMTVEEVEARYGK